MRFRITMTGTAPMLMHNGRLANPLDPATQALKALTSKRKKTDEDLVDIARAEFMGGLYIDPDVGPYIPGENIERSILDGAKLTKNGANIKRGMFIETDVNPLSYKGPRTADALWDDENFRHIRTVRNQMNRVSRCRPVFNDWAVAAEGTLDESILDFRTLESIIEQCGLYIGLGDWRPRYGRNSPSSPTGTYSPTSAQPNSSTSTPTPTATPSRWPSGTRPDATRSTTSTHSKRYRTSDTASCSPPNTHDSHASTSGAPSSPSRQASPRSTTST